MSQEGFLIITDITGYSAFLNKSELEHARDSLTDLLNLLIEYTRSPLVISKLEGDAVFSYAPKGSFNQGQTLLEMIETTYIAFRKALELMIINTTCTCNACRNIPNLDLKFLIHYGPYSQQKLGRYTELVGNEVVLVHRIAKNQIIARTGLVAYAAYTQQLIDAMQMGSMAENMIRHEEEFADVGVVRLHIQDLRGVWEKRKEEVRIIVKPEEAIFTGEYVFHIPQLVLWDYLTNPEYRKFLYSSDYQTTNGLTDGRINAGTAYVCAHGNSESIHTVLDWQPFEQYTATQTFLGDAHQNVTTMLEPVDHGTMLKMYYGKSQGSIFYRTLTNVMLPFWSLPWQKLMGNLGKQIEQDLLDGKTVVSPKIEFGNELASQAAAESLVDNATAGS